MASYVRTKYEADDDTIHAIRLSPAKNLIAGQAPAGAVNSAIKVKVSKSKREFGISPRGVTIAREFGTDPDVFQKYVFIPVLTEEIFDGAAYQLNATLQYEGEAWQIVARNPEDY